ncbi:hypothetical protein EMIHUDRAFT_235752 [Emiliania huxleyi CCMP1516]|uniref:Uncharacterized protein n=2 Tax=Emiliania huxleyi TaxID=2903 RepID=A0A0D3JVI7_EMIH1|nr:hypothetical protein EMIHUDRAFT_235752 [Emiliania huxleyi CCMP1516]EOD27522.1 hypothetical protein EMIHUDRAFT_235752 [Emiliania huxleyi CCMP1516]|eukprot:XP_005779951.1 hypothetical protein EMIHUDRAFT_235752 [Emiliania huxleyi CCMP1516]
MLSMRACSEKSRFCLIDERKLAKWRGRGGGDLEPVLASGAIALLDAQWIISHAEAGGVLTHRQALPKEAFLSLADLVEATTGNDNSCRASLPVAALSYPRTKDHPDPLGFNLIHVAKALKALLSDQYGSIPRLGVFWDFASLHQHPDPANGIMRTEEQNVLFKQGVGCLGKLYSHPKTIVLRLTSFPDGHKKEDQAEGTNVAAYSDCGWCAAENAWASLTKSLHLSLDLGLMRDGKAYDYHSLFSDCTNLRCRRPPLLPSAFAAELETKSFTNGKDDKPLVKRLYAVIFDKQFGKQTQLDYGFHGWGDAETAQLAGVLARGAAPRLEKLYLRSNEIGDEGCKALAAALGKEGAAPRLEYLYLDGNKIGDEGCKALAAALGKEGAAPRLEYLYLNGNQMGDEGCKALAAALGKEGAAPRLEYLYLDGNKIGDEGCKALAATLGKEGAVPRLETLGLTCNKIGDEGCKALAAALGKEGAGARLEELWLSRNQIGDEGCKALADALGKERAAPRLKKLGLTCNKIGDEGNKALAAALGKEGAGARLEELWLSHNQISDEGCKALAAALGKEGAAPRLETLYLGNDVRWAADVLQNKLTRAQYLDEIVNVLACGEGGRVHGAKCLAVLAGVA